MDRGLWPQTSTFPPTGVVLIPHPSAGILQSSCAMALLEKAFPSTCLHSLEISPLPIKMWVCRLGLELFQREQNKTKRGLYIAAPAGSRRKQLLSQEQRRRRMKNIWPAESTTTAAEPSLVHSTVRSSSETQDSASTFPEILWRGSDSCRWDRGISQKEPVVLETAIFKRWAKYLET